MHKKLAWSKWRLWHASYNIIGWTTWTQVFKIIGLFSYTCGKNLFSNLILQNKHQGKETLRKKDEEQRSLGLCCASFIGDWKVESKLLNVQNFYVPNNFLFKISKRLLRWPGIEPGSTAWKAAMLTIIPPTLNEKTMKFSQHT